MGQTLHLLFIFIIFTMQDKYCTNLTINSKNIDGVLETQTQGGRMVGADESTELCRHPINCFFFFCFFFANTCTLSFYSPSPIEAKGTVYFVGLSWTLDLLYNCDLFLAILYL